MISKLARDSVNPNILVVCNEPSTAAIWGYTIREHRLNAIIETHPQNALTYCTDNDPILVILDLQLPHAECLELCRRIRLVVDNPILILLQSYDEQHIMDYYTTGIDDCVVKPISPVVFYLKVKAWLQHSKIQPFPAMDERRVGDIFLKPDQRILVKPDGNIIKLSGIEVRILHLLMGRPGHVFNSKLIVNKVWGLYGEQDLAILKYAIFRLRRKLEDDPENPRWIQTWHGKGYTFNSD